MIAIANARLGSTTRVPFKTKTRNKTIALYFMYSTITHVCNLNVLGNP